MILVCMIAKTFRRRAHCFATDTIAVVPASIEPIFRELRIVLLVVLEFLFSHEDTSIIAHEVTVLDVLIYVFGTTYISSRLAYLHQIVYSQSK